MASALKRFAAVSSRSAIHARRSACRTFVSRADKENEKYPSGTRTPWEHVKHFFLYYPDGDNQNTPAEPTSDSPKLYRATSSERASVPTVVDDDTIYDIQYYTRDTRRDGAHIKGVPGENPYAALLPDPESVEAMGSPGNNNPAVLIYDETGTRSAMSTTHEQVIKMVKEKYPDHLPRQAGAIEGTDAHADYLREVSKDIPTPIGVRAKWKGARALEPLNSSFE